MFRRRSSFPLDRVLAESLEPRVLYSASPIQDWSPSPDFTTDWGAESVQVAQPWSESDADAADRAAEAEHHLSHLLDQTETQEEWSLLSNWIAARLSALD